MQRFAACDEEWICTDNESHRNEVAGRALATVLGILKDTAVMSVVVMTGVVVTLLLG